MQLEEFVVDLNEDLTFDVDWLIQVPCLHSVNGLVEGKVNLGFTYNLLIPVYCQTLVIQYRNVKLAAEVHLVIQLVNQYFIVFFGIILRL